MANSGCTTQLMPTPNLWNHSDVNPFADVPEALRTSNIDVLLVTDRAEKEKSGQPEFGYGRSRSLAWGSYVVGVGKNLSWDDLVREYRTGSRRKDLSLSRREVRLLGQFPETPPKRTVTNGVIKDDPEYSPRLEEARAAFCQEIARRIAQS